MSRIQSSYSIVAGVVGNWRRDTVTRHNGIYNYGKCLAVVCPRSEYGSERGQGRAGMGKHARLEAYLRETPTDVEFMQLEHIGRWLLENLKPENPAMFEKTYLTELRQRVIYIRKNNEDGKESWSYEIDEDVLKENRINGNFRYSDSFGTLQQLIDDLAQKLKISPLGLDSSISPAAKLPQLPKSRILAERARQLIIAMKPSVAA